VSGEVRRDPDGGWVCTAHGPLYATRAMDLAGQPPRCGVCDTEPAPARTEQPSFTCPECGATSWHPQDVQYGYCGRCHAFTGANATLSPGTSHDGA
jgi:hypothetical protein